MSKALPTTEPVIILGILFLGKNHFSYVYLGGKKSKKSVISHNARAFYGLYTLFDWARFGGSLSLFRGP